MIKVALMSGLTAAFLSSSIGFLPALAQDAVPVPALRASALAPADAYFGRFRMSILGMRNAIEDIAARIDRASYDDLAVYYHKLTMVEDAVLDLKDQYPGDTWLPQLGLSIAQAFAKIPIPGARAHADTNLNWLLADYSTSDQALYADSLRHGGTSTASAQIPIEPVLPNPVFAAPLRVVSPPVAARPAVVLPSYAVWPTR